MEKTTTAAALATTLPEFDTTCDVEFARRSVRYMLNNWCDANEIVDTLTIDLGVSSDVAQSLAQRDNNACRRLSNQPRHSGL